MSSHWCHRCNKFVRVWRLGMPICSDCDSGFVEELEHQAHSLHADAVRPRRLPMTAAMYMIGHHNNNSNQNQNQNQNPRRRYCRNNVNGGDISTFNPIVMIRSGGTSEGTSREGEENRRYELFYEDGPGSGLRPLPPRMSETLLGPGFERVMGQLSNVEANRNGNETNNRKPLPASKSTVESLPSIEINNNHVEIESQCAVCKDHFELGAVAREMPCKHIYHNECILPWLEIRNSCPICRHELPCESPQSNNNEQDNVGLTIWRLPGGGFAVGRFTGGSRENNEGELPIVYTELDGGFNNVGEPRRISWSMSTSNGGGRGRSNIGGGFRRMLNNLFGCLGGGDGSSNEQGSISTTREFSETMTTRNNNNSNASRTNLNSSSRARRTWSMDVNGGIRPW
ncbi:E3 ubiquitin-protein ligase RDUF2-like [Lathyrus oleraceus]|uniref:E3 ubiquitin-protein ligase RDUF2-like n=1 Tax=Pisum sativum TaxID=3888 RepID=UPI0021D0931B|nr:E3 ubiquitin-protein ligase RDUF2-like [Pisum sativum]